MDVILNKDNHSIGEIVDRIISLLNIYEYNEVMKLFTYSSIILNREAVNSSGFKVSPRLLGSIPFMYVKKCKNGDRKISNMDETAAQYINLLYELTMCYTNIVDYSQKDTFHKSYLSYHLDYPLISIRQYFCFFYINREIVSKIYGVHEDKINDFIHSFFLLINFERAWKKKLKFNFHSNFVKWRNRNSIIKFGHKDIFYQFPIEIVKLLFKEFEIDCSDAINKLFIDSSKFEKNGTTTYPTDIRKAYSEYLGIRNNNFVTFTRNVNSLNHIYEYILNSEEFKERKGDYLEERTEILLKYMFGNNNVYHRIYDEDGNEQDFIVIYNNYIISLECKASRFAEPFVNKNKAQIRLKQNFKRTIQKGYDQTERIARNFRKRKFKYYNDDSLGKRKEVLDISTYDIKKFQSVIITMENYHSLGTELHLSLKQDEYINLPLVISIYSFEILLQKCKLSYNIDKFIEYLENRTKFYGKVYPANSDELDCFGYYLKYGNKMQKPIRDIFINIGPGYSSFVSDILEVDNFMIFNELYGI